MPLIDFARIALRFTEPVALAEKQSEFAANEPARSPVVRIHLAGMFLPALLQLPALLEVFHGTLRQTFMRAHQSVAAYPQWVTGRELAGSASCPQARRSENILQFLNLSILMHAILLPIEAISYPAQSNPCGILAEAPRRQGRQAAFQFCREKSWVVKPQASAGARRAVPDAIRAVARPVVPGVLLDWRGTERYCPTCLKLRGLLLRNLTDRENGKGRVSQVSQVRISSYPGMTVFLSIPQRRGVSE